MPDSSHAADLRLKVAAEDSGPPAAAETIQTLPAAELLVVGTGIQVVAQATRATEGALRGAEIVLFAVTSPWAARWIRELNPNSRSFTYARDGRPRREIYRTMVAEVVDALGAHHRVCAAFYGSPTLFTFPAHEAIRQARANGFRARMLPGVSSLDCLFADLGVDPGDGGCQLFEASDFLAKRHPLNCRAHLVLFQLALVGNPRTFEPADTTTIRSGLLSLTAWLREWYPADHRVVVYEAATTALDTYRAESVALGSLPDITVSEVCSLYVPAVGSRPWEACS